MADARKLHGAGARGRRAGRSGRRAGAPDRAGCLARAVCGRGGAASGRARLARVAVRRRRTSPNVPCRDGNRRYGAPPSGGSASPRPREAPVRDRSWSGVSSFPQPSLAPALPSSLAPAPNPQRADRAEPRAPREGEGGADPAPVPRGGVPPWPRTPPPYRGPLPPARAPTQGRPRRLRLPWEGSPRHGGLASRRGAGRRLLRPCGARAGAGRSPWPRERRCRPPRVRRPVRRPGSASPRPGSTAAGGAASTAGRAWVRTPVRP